MPNNTLSGIFQHAGCSDVWAPQCLQQTRVHCFKQNIGAASQWISATECCLAHRPLTPGLTLTPAVPIPHPALWELRRATAEAVPASCDSAVARPNARPAFSKISLLEGVGQGAAKRRARKPTPGSRAVPLIAWNPARAGKAQGTKAVQGFSKNTSQVLYSTILRPNPGTVCPTYPRPPNGRAHRLLGMGTSLWSACWALLSN